MKNAIKDNLFIYFDKYKTDNLNSHCLGGKGLNLLRLVNLGVNVPPFLVITSEFFDLLDDDQKLINMAYEEVKNFMGIYDCKYISVRSSMGLEDGAESSFAGIMDSYLFVDLENVQSQIINCYKSLFRKRSEVYQNAKGIKEEKPRAAVIIQKMIDSKVSGVAFSRSPVGNSALTLIESSFGLGEGVVSGQVEVDQYQLDRFSNLYREKIVEKYKTVVFNKSENDIKLTDLPSEYSAQSSLTRKQLIDLNEILLDLERKIEYPCDIEWCYDETQILFILQIRPITQKFSDLRYYVDTNLSESYPGHVTPLTGSFVRRIYTKVFSESFSLLTSKSIVPDNLQNNYDFLIKEIDGHLYYDLHNYYSVLYSLPGGKANIDNWHKMIGGKVNYTPDLSKSHTLGKIDTIRSILFFIKITIFHSRIYNKFYSNSDKMMKELITRQKHSSNKSKELSTLITYAIREVKGFSYTILNDYLIMSAIKGLSKILNKYDKGEESLIQYLKTDEVVESLKPLVALKDLISIIKSYPDFFKIYEKILNNWDGISAKKFYRDFFNDLKEREYTEVLNCLEQYLKLYGDRSFEELKLESLSFSQSPDNFLFFLKWNLDQKFDTQKKESKTNHSAIVMSYVDQNLFKILLRITKMSIATREKTRLVRGRYYGWIRSAFLDFIEALKKENSDFQKLDNLDFFLLSIEDLENYSTEKNENLLDIIQKGKKIKNEKSSYPEFFCHPENEDSSPYFLQDAIHYNVSNSDSKLIIASGASQGEVIGEALVLFSPNDAFNVDNLEDKILVTQNTDPAWIFIMRSCRGLISEKGSLLSHTAIIGRELQIPTVVGLKDATKIIENGRKVRLNGKTGEIELLD